MSKVVQLTLGSVKIFCPLKEVYLTQVEKHCREVGKSEFPFADFFPSVFWFYHCGQSAWPGMGLEPTS